MATNDDINTIKLQFFSYRNGIVASRLRNSGDSHKYIMGCMLPDITDISRNYKQSIELAHALWSEKEHRECRLAATMLYPVEKLNFDTAIKWCYEVENHEIADVLCLRLLCRCSFASELWNKLLQSEDDLMQYIGLRILANLTTKGEPLSHKTVGILSQYSLNAKPSLAKFAKGIMVED